MAGYLNKAIIIGNLGRDPELSKTTGGNSVCAFSVATTERYTDKQGQRQEKTEWHNIVVWGKQAESTAQYLTKGSSVCVEGKMTTRTWDNNEGVKQYKSEIVANNVQFLDSKSDNQQGQQQAPQQRGFGGAPQQQAPAGLPVEDELPF